jgi:hypothetical protein
MAELMAYGAKRRKPYQSMSLLYRLNEFLRRLYLKLNEFAGSRMYESQVFRVQCHPGKRDLPAVFGIAHYRMAYVRKMDPQLMSPAGIRLQLNKAQAFGPLERAVMRLCVPGIYAGPHCHVLAFGRMPAYGQLDYILIILDFAFDQSDIFAFDGMIRKLFGKRMMRNIVFGNYEQAGCFFVKPVNNARPHRIHIRQRFKSEQ